jgi:N-methylhydantoinase B/oxoprolinase/acetone carboxylase alpha subunit
MLNSEPCGWGGRPFADGNSAVNVYNGNCTIVPIEVLESRYPIVHELRLNEDSPGAGKYRGGLGLIRTYKLSGDLRLSSFIEREKVTSTGLWGGKNGSKATVQVRTHDDKQFRTFKAKFGVACNGKFSDIHLKKSDAVKVVMPGGAGWGDPLKRGFDAIVRDVEEGYISKARAIRDYCVAFKTEKGKLMIDNEETNNMREKLKRVQKKRGA